MIILQKVIIIKVKKNCENFKTSNLKIYAKIEKKFKFKNVQICENVENIQTFAKIKKKSKKVKIKLVKSLNLRKVKKK